MEVRTVNLTDVTDMTDAKFDALIGYEEEPIVVEFTAQKFTIRPGLCSYCNQHKQHRVDEVGECVDCMPESTRESINDLKAQARWARDWYSAEWYEKQAEYGKAFLADALALQRKLKKNA